MERKLSLINFRKFGYTTRDCPFLRKFPSIYTGLSRVEDRKEGALIAIYGHRFGRGKSLASCNTIILYPREDESGNSPAIWHYYSWKEEWKGFKKKWLRALYAFPIFSVSSNIFTSRQVPDHSPPSFLPLQRPLQPALLPESTSRARDAQKAASEVRFSALKAVGLTLEIVLRFQISPAKYGRCLILSIRVSFAMLIMYIKYLWVIHLCCFQWTQRCRIMALLTCHMYLARVLPRPLHVNVSCQSLRDLRSDPWAPSWRLRRRVLVVSTTLLIRWVLYWHLCFYFSSTE